MQKRSSSPPNAISHTVISTERKGTIGAKPDDEVVILRSNATKDLCISHAKRAIAPKARPD